MRNLWMFGGSEADFYIFNFPGEYWKPLWVTNPIESTYCHDLPRLRNTGGVSGGGLTKISKFNGSTQK